MFVRKLSKGVVTFILATMCSLLVVTPVAAHVAPAAATGFATPPDEGGDLDAETARDIQALMQLGIQPFPPCSDAEQRARQDTNGTLWFLGGCLFGLLGVGAAYVIEPSPPASALVGQDDQYVATYTDCYQDTAQGIQQRNALYGCLLAGGLWAAYYVVVIVALASSDLDNFD